MRHQPLTSSTDNRTIVIHGVVKSNMGPVGTGDEPPELFPDDRPKGPMSHAFEAGQRFKEGFSLE